MGLRRDRSIRTPEALVAEGDRLLTGNGVAQSYSEAFWYYKKAASKGYPPAMYRLGCMYESGHGVEQSYKHAYKWYDQAALNGDKESAAALGFLYEAGLGTRRSRALAIENMETAAHAGSVRAMNNLGLIYLDRSSPEFSDHAAVTWFQKGNLAPFAPSTANLARMYETGKGLTRNCSTASNLLRKAAVAGNLPAKFCLAEMLKYGIGIDANPEAASHLFTEAARWGDARSVAEINGEDVDEEVFVARPGTETNPRMQLNYGLMFLFGVFAPYAPETAFFLLESAAEAGNTDAMYVLGQAFENGIGYSKSPELARKWYTWGADKGNGPCAYVLGWMYESGYDNQEKDPAMAMEYYRKSVACEQDDDAMSDAYYALGYLLMTTEGGDEVEGLECFVKAADLGNANAQFRAGRILLEKGDAEKGWHYVEMAAAQGDDRAKALIETRH